MESHQSISNMASMPMKISRIAGGGESLHLKQNKVYRVPKRIFISTNSISLVAMTHGIRNKELLVLGRRVIKSEYTATCQVLLVTVLKKYRSSLREKNSFSFVADVIFLHFDCSWRLTCSSPPCNTPRFLFLL